MSKLYSAADIGQTLGVTADQIPRHARKLGIGRQISGVWIFTASDVPRLRKSVRGRVGNPNFKRKA